MKYVQTFEEFTGGINPKKVSDTHEVAQEESVEKISAKDPETIEEPELTEKDIAANAQTEKDKAEMLKAIKQFNKEKNQDLNKLYNELLFHVGEPDTKKNVDKLNSYLLDNNLIKYTVSEDTNSIQAVHQLFESESIESSESVNEANYGVTLRKEAQKAAKDFVSNLAKEYNMSASDAKTLAVDLDKVLSACERAASYRDPSASANGW